MNIRTASVAGSFYPNNCEEIKRYIEHFNTILKNSDYGIETNIKPKAIIVPHAGYIYSGFTANIAYRYTQNIEPKRVVAIGPSHNVFLNGASVALFEKYQTPCANLEIDMAYSAELIKKFDFLHFDEKVHAEHSTETQFPFIENYIKNISVVEIVYGKIDPPSLSKLMDFILNDDQNLLIISTDLSHFYSQSEANKIDNICLHAIADMDIKAFNNGCEACGIIGVKALMESAKKMGLQTKILDYRTSADASRDTTRVVGYVSALIYA